MVHEVCCTFFKIVSDFFEAEFLTSVKNKMLEIHPSSPQTHSTSVYKHLQAPGASLQVFLHFGHFQVLGRSRGPYSYVFFDRTKIQILCVIRD